MSPRCLVLGCNTAQVPYIQEINKLGFEAIGTDLNPGAPGAAVVDKLWNVSYLEPGRIVSLAKDEGFGSEDKLFTASSQHSFAGASRVAESLGIEFISSESVDICLDKVKFYRFLELNNISVPQYELIHDIEGIEFSKIRNRFLKSDYGKSPRYCFELSGERAPCLPKSKDQFYRNCFLLQEKIIGDHYRIIIFQNEMIVFLKISDRHAVPVYSLGPSSGVIKENLQKIVSLLGLQRVMVKFDLIVRMDEWYVIDIGIDPPNRLKYLYQYHGLNFFRAFVKYALLGDSGDFVKWDDLVTPIVIESTTEDIRFHEYGDAR